MVKVPFPPRRPVGAEEPRAGSIGRSQRWKERRGEIRNRVEMKMGRKKGRREK